MSSALFQLVLRQYIEHKDPANLRLHLWSNVLFWLGWSTMLSQVPLPGTNLGVLWVCASVLYWFALDVPIALAVLGLSALWANLPLTPWGPGHGWLLGVILPALAAITGGFAALYAHIYHHEHAEYLKTDNRRRDALETTHAVFWGIFHFWICGALATGYRPALRARFDAAERARIGRQERVGWENWARNVSCRPAVVCVPQSLDELQEAVAEAARAGRKVRVVASGFTWAAWVPTDDTLIFSERLIGVAVDAADPARPAVWAECGAMNRHINQALAAAGLELPYNVLLETVRVGGIVSMGTHGSGQGTATLGDLVDAFDIIDGSGQRRILSEETIGAEGMAAARLGLGLFGVIARVRLRVQPACRVLQEDMRVTLSEARARLPELVATRESVEYFWFPFTDWVWLRAFSRTDRPLTRASHGVLFNTRNFLEMAVSLRIVAMVTRHLPGLLPRLMPLALDTLAFTERVIPRTDAIHYRRFIEVSRCSCLEVGFKTPPDLGPVLDAITLAQARVADWAGRGRFPVDLTLNVRFTGPSGALLSPAFGPGLTAFVEILCLDRTVDWEPFSAELGAQWMAIPTALPHWAKEFRQVPGIIALAQSRLGERRDRFVAAWRASGVDPKGMFVNRQAQELLGLVDGD